MSTSCLASTPAPVPAHGVCCLSQVGCLVRVAWGMRHSYKLACMSAAASGCLQLKMHQCSREAGWFAERYKCKCGPTESLFPIPLVESFPNHLRLYYGKTLHDETSAYPSRAVRGVPPVVMSSSGWSGCPACVAAGVCEHRVGCFFDQQISTWSDALLALSVMQAAAMDVHERFIHMPQRQRDAAATPVPALPSLHVAHTAQASPLAAGRDETGANAGEANTANELSADMAALQAAGVADITTLDPPPMLVLYEEGNTPPAQPRVRGCEPHRRATCVGICGLEGLHRRMTYACPHTCVPPPCGAALAPRVPGHVDTQRCDAGCRGQGGVTVPGYA